MKVFYTVTINGKDYTHKTVFPLKTGNLLDEQLDEANIQLVLCKEDRFDLLSKVKITVKTEHNDILSSEKEHYFIIANDRATLMIKDKMLYRHELYLLEETKLLEGLIGDSIVFTNTLGNLYTLNAPFASFTDTSTVPRPNIKKTTPNNYKTVIKVGEDFSFASVSSIFQTINIDSASMRVLFNGEPIFNTSDEKATFTTELQEGTYTAYYEVSFVIPPNGEATITGYYEMNAILNRYPLKKWTITDVVQRTLDLIEPHLSGIPNRFTFDPVQAEYYKNVIAPEFAFTRENLRERLQQIGGFIHAEPRLRNGVISFDRYGQSDYASIASVPYTALTVSRDINLYATNLDSSVDNLVSQLSWAKGVIMEPYFDGYRSVRTESYNIRITEENMLIQTMFPVYQVEKLICGYIKDNALKTCDITPYVFESSDYYGALSSFAETYPTSKAFGIFYTQGEKNIKGLTHKVPDAVSEIFKNYAIVNILAAASGESRDFFANYGYPKLMFQITYIPIFGTRVTQTKQYIVGMKHPFALPYNQGANLIETAYYGENMKGLIARLGNVEKVVSYKLYDLEKIPKAGQLWDHDYYISAVYTEYMPGYINVSCSLSKDFNRLSQYVSVPSYKRFYEVSERQAFKRELIYTDYLVIGNPEKDDGQSFIASPFLQYVKNTFDQKQEDNSQITLAYIFGYNKKNEKINEKSIEFPVLSTALGTTMNFSFSAEDNYSAGARSEYGEYLAANNQTVSGYWQQYVPYGDYYGRLYYLTFGFTQKSIPEDAQDAALKFPAYSNTSSSQSALIHTGNASAIADPAQSVEPYLLYRKDSREIMNVTYQATFVTNWNNIVIGSALAAMNPLVCGGAKKIPAKLYLLKERINKFTDFVNVTDMTEQAWDPKDITINGTVLSLGKFTPNIIAQAWAIIYSPNEEDTDITVEDEDGNVITQSVPVGDRLLIGCNGNFVMGLEETLPSISIVHNIFKE